MTPRRPQRLKRYRRDSRAEQDLAKQAFELTLHSQDKVVGTTIHNRIVQQEVTGAMTNNQIIPIMNFC
jgi:hypothetical protein